MNALEIKNLTKNFKEFKLDGINLVLPEGYILGYIGQNGAGKTTTIKLIMGHLQREGGEISVYGKEFKDNEIFYKDIIGYIADECYYPFTFNVEDVQVTMKTFHPSFDENKFKKYIKKWGLPEKKPIKDFSKGMKVKLMFAGVLARDTKLLILDEPTSGLDPVMRTEILELLQEYISDGSRSVLFSTHIMSDLEKIADYLCFVENGRIVFNDTKDAVLENYLLAKGGPDELTLEFKKKMIGLNSSKTGFTALIPAKEKRYAKSGVIFEKPGIDDIVVFHINGIRG
jgi:ABC-type multidrug transport system, ATPase component